MSQVFATCGNIIFVKTDAVGFLQDGSSWGNAFLDLQSALDEAEACPDIQEIWVAGGTYLPTIDVGGGTGSGIQNLVFNVDFEVKIYGGFCGWESALNERVKYLCPTILSGDHNEDDVLINDKNDIDFPFSNDSDNSYNIMRMKNLTNETIIDGLTFSGGNADHSTTFSKRTGGAIFNDRRGLNDTSSPQISNCIFQYNKARLGGGAVYNYGVGGVVSPIIRTSEFRCNRSYDSGGAIYNHASGDGSMSNPVIRSCLFENNLAAEFGGGMYSIYELSGIAIPELSHTTFVHNEAKLGAGFFANRTSGQASPSLTFSGCLFFFNLATDAPSNSSFASNNVAITAQYSLYPEATVDQINFNTNVNPQFVNNLSNYRLLPSSPAIDKGELDSGILLSTSERDLDDNARRLGSLRDMGAYEFLSCPIGGVIYVDDNATAIKNGSTPSTGLSSLNMALNMACNCSGSPIVDIAEGRYVPHRNSDLSINDDRTKHVFELECSVELRGEQNTILSADILNDDINFIGMNDGPERDDNCQNLIMSTGIENIVLDSLRVESAQLQAVRIIAGIVDLNVAVTNSNFSYNNSDVIGVFSSDTSRSHSVNIENCRFNRNSTQSLLSDGCIHVRTKGRTGLKISDCTFIDNAIGGVFISMRDSSTSRVERCDFRENTSYNGAGVEIDDILRGTSFHKITSCTFVDNTGENAGAAVYARRTHDTNIEIESCTFFRNHTDSHISGSVNFFSNMGSARVIDCIFWDNTNNSGDSDISGDVDISYSMLRTESCPSSGVRCGEVMFYDVDPMFSSENGTFGANLNLRESSLAINRGSKTASGPTGIDVAGHVRIQSSRIDLGAYENQFVDCVDVIVNPIAAPETLIDMSLVAHTSIELSQEYITPETGALFINAPETNIYPSLEIKKGAVMEVGIFGCDN